MRLAALMMMSVPLAGVAAECSVRSGPHVPALVELYTSEGCSSCPPADRWLSRFSPAVADGSVVPLAFHVSYWDYIGWKDAFADPRYTERQRDLASATGARYVYTPQVVLDGRDFPSWSNARPTSSSFNRRKPATVSLDVALRVAADQTVVAEVVAAGKSAMPAADLALVTAITQNGLGSKVTAGENRGEKLAHDFVVRDMAVSRGLGMASATFKPKADWIAANMSVAAFVQNVKTGEVLQAVSLPLCR